MNKKRFQCNFWYRLPRNCTTTNLRSPQSPGRNQPPQKPPPQKSRQPPIQKRPFTRPNTPRARLAAAAPPPTPHTPTNPPRPSWTPRTKTPTPRATVLPTISTTTAVRRRRFPETGITPVPGVARRCSWTGWSAGLAGRRRGPAHPARWAPRPGETSVTDTRRGVPFWWRSSRRFVF